MTIIYNVRAWKKEQHVKLHTEFLTMDGSETKETASFDVFAKDIPITEQEIVLQMKNVLITTGWHKI